MGSIKITIQLFIYCWFASSCFQEKKPNILFILARGLGWQDVGFRGSQWLKTPNLDTLAKKSLVFTQAYMYPTCSPSRAALLTGKQSFRTGFYNVPVFEKGKDRHNISSRWTVGLEHTMYAQPLKEAGYKSIRLGKWHVVGDPVHGHDKEYQSESGGDKAPFKNPSIEDQKDYEWLTDRLTDEAIDFIKKTKTDLFWHLASIYKNPPFSIIRKGDWKFIQFLKDGKVELYNLDEDLKETENLVDKNRDKTAELLSELGSWRKENGVPLPPALIFNF